MNHKLGLIFAFEQQKTAHELGLKSDREIVQSMTTGWRGGQPTMTTMSAAKTWLTEQAQLCDKLRAAGNLPPLEEIARHFGTELYKLRENFQKRNDCTAFSISMAASARILFQKWMGAELKIARFNPSGIYVASSPSRLKEGYSVPDNGRTLDAVCVASNETGMFTTDDIGDYDGSTVYSTKIQQATENASGYQCGWIFHDDTDSPEDVLLLSLRACCPVITGNTIAVGPNVSKDSNGVEAAQVTGAGWGGGHAQAWIDYQRVNSDEYAMDCNSWGDDYFTSGKPYAFVNTNGIRTFFSGNYNDLATCFAAESTDDNNTDLNPEYYNK